MTGGIRNRIRSIQERISASAVRSGRSPEAVTLIAVTKTVPSERVLEAYEAGLRHFGENRVQEALPKIAALPSDIHWHLIGRLQSNKINKILGRFGIIHSVDSVALGEDLSRRLSGSRQEILLEVNTSGEGTKAGVETHRALETARVLRGLPGLVVRGLMTIGPLTEEGERRRDAFRRLREVFEAIRIEAGPGFDILSMGMSSDFEEAIEQGSTHVRVGTALFGERA